MKGRVVTELHGQSLGYQLFNPMSLEGIKILQRNGITYEELNRCIDWPVRLGISDDGAMGSENTDWKLGDPVDVVLWITMKEYLGKAPHGASQLFMDSLTHGGKTDA